LAATCGALCSTALIPNAVAATNAIAIAIEIPIDCLTVGMITSVLPVKRHHPRTTKGEL
jgi:hypothetical protein